MRTIVGRAGRQAGLPFPVHPHMLRHATGYRLANDGHDTRAIRQYLGHRNILHSTRSTELAPDRFKDFWHDLPRLPEARWGLLVADAGCTHLQWGLPETGLVLYLLGAPDAGPESLTRLGDHLVGIAAIPGEPLHSMPASIHLDLLTRTSDFGAIGYPLEIRILEQPPAGWSVWG